VTACAICGSDLHIYGGIIQSMHSGDILGHEDMDQVVEVGPNNKELKVGDRVVVPFTIASGEYFFCRNRFYSGCEGTNPDHDDAAMLWGNAPSGLLGYSHMLGGYAGGQAEYLRVHARMWIPSGSGRRERREGAAAAYGMPAETQKKPLPGQRRESSCDAGLAARVWLQERFPRPDVPAARANPKRGPVDLRPASCRKVN
jgi:threonine dehydrogenase-like Zn-dependent dehydrogenase